MKSPKASGTTAIRKGRSADTRKGTGSRLFGKSAKSTAVLYTPGDEHLGPSDESVTAGQLEAEGLTQVEILAAPAGDMIKFRDLVSGKEHYGYWDEDSWLNKHVP